MTEETEQFEKINPNVRWALIECLRRSYMAGVCDEDREEWLERYQSLSEDEQEVLKWKMEEGHSAITLLMKAMKDQGANSISELRDIDDEPPTAV